MTARLVGVIVTTCLGSGLFAQPASVPNLTRSQRDLLKAIVLAVDAADASSETSDAVLRTHVLRASDGSHYVAFTAGAPPSWPSSKGPAMLYVRLATAASIPSARPERSPVREWLVNNQTTAPPPIAPNRGIALGEMPIMGPAGSFEQRPPQTPEMANLTILDLERRRARERNDARERQRKSELEGLAANTSDILPFEDFDLGATSSRLIQRALTAGPGDYFIYIGSADPAATNPEGSVRVIKKRLTLPAATTTALTIGSVILADGIQVRASAYPPQEQASHPYAIGLTEILPAADATFADNERLSLVFQIINAKPTASGKPNLDVMFEVVRLVSNHEQPVAALTPQTYSEATLPPEFDLRVGHPLFATVAAPLSTLTRGAYRLKILVNDKVAEHSATAEAEFTVTATAAALLKDAPALGAPFRPESVLGQDALPTVLAALRPASPSPQLQRAFDLAIAGKFVDLMAEEPVPAGEEGVRVALRGLALFAVGDASSAVQFQRAQLLGAPLAASRFLSGAARAMQSRDADAISGWLEALSAGAPRTLVVPQLLDAYLRRNDVTRAAALVADTPRTAWARGSAAVLIATQKEREAIAMLDARLTAMPNDRDAQWLLVHALFSQLVRDDKAPAATRERFARQAQAYIASGGVHAAIADEWLKAISSF